VVGAAEGDPAELDAVDSPTVQAERGDGEAIGGNERAADGPAVAGKKSQCQQRLYGQTKPGTLLKHHIPVKTTVGT